MSSRGSDNARLRTGGRLARRARSFKQDLFDKLNQIRSTSTTRSSSPSANRNQNANKTHGNHKHNHSKSRNSKGEQLASLSANKVAPMLRLSFDSPMKKSTIKTKNENDFQSAILFVKQLTSALRYFQDVVEKDKLEQLPGSASILLEIILTGYSELKPYLMNSEQSSLVISSTNQVYQSLANLIRWSDTVLLRSDKSLDKESVGEIAKSVLESVNSLVQLCIERYQNKESYLRSNNDTKNSVTSNGMSSPASNNGNNRLTHRKPDSISIQLRNSNSSPTNSPSHRSSLPEIPLSPREKEILETTNFATPPPLPFRSGFIEHLNHSLSSDSLINASQIEACISSDETPPPKPPLPTIDGLRQLSLNDVMPCVSHSVIPPPLPPKKSSSSSRGVMSQTSIDWSNCDSSNCTSIGNSMDSCLNYIGNNHLSADDLLAINQSKSKFDFESRRERFDSCGGIISHLNDDKGVHSLHSSHKSYKYSSFSHTTSTTTSTQRFHCLSDVPNFYLGDKPLASSPPSLSNKIDSLIDKMKSFNTKSSPSTDEYDTVDGAMPPQLPVKLRPKLSLSALQSTPYPNRPPSQYDNIMNEFQSSLFESDQNRHQWNANNHSAKCPHSTSCPHFSTTIVNFDEIDNYNEDLDNSKPPPLPPKKRNILNYMQMVGSYNGPVESEFYRHSMHTHQLIQNQWQQVELSFMQQRSITTSFVSASSDDSVFSYESEASLTTPPILPPKKSKTLHLTDNNSLNTNKILSSPDILPRTSTPVSLVPSSESGISSQSELTRIEPEELQHESSALDEMDVSNHIITKGEQEDGPEIRGGSIDALVVKATEVSKNDFMFQEAFLTTYRTLLAPMELINKLLYRYNKFILMSDIRQRAARNAFALLVRVVDDMCIGDCSDVVLQKLMDFIYQLVNRGDLALAKVLRAKVIEKMDQRESLLHASNVLLPSIGVTIKQSSLFDFKSEHLAEQMTLLDSKLFLKIEIPEVLVWAKEQREELIPNLNTFTEHFNKMSYWTRSRILELEEAKERERLVMKFIKIMKHLRKLNNFNSYLAILSALDSAPIRRLEWQRSITEGLKEYSALIDSSSSFRTYRQALADTEPPCIPYIGLILQDLTFVHIGNNDYLPDGNINFAKRWQQYNILDQMRRFKNCHYSFKRNEQIISFFNNFDNYLNEEAMWQISESIKPRGVSKK